MQFKFVVRTSRTDAYHVLVCPTLFLTPVAAVGRCMSPGSLTFTISEVNQISKRIIYYLCVRRVRNEA